MATADEVLFEKVFAPVYFKVAAARGVVPSSQEEADEMLRIGFLQAQAGVQAQEPVSVIKQASAALQQYLMAGAAGQVPQLDLSDVLSAQTKQAVAQAVAADKASAPKA